MEPLIIANWKANMGREEANAWLSFFKDYKDLPFVICPPFTLLELVSEFIKKNSLPLKVGAQDVSVFAEGPYTGEITASQLKDFAEYVLVGHSERRRIFNLTQEDIKNKLTESKTYNLKPVLCISDLEQLKDIDISGLIIAFEPIESIGTDNPMDAGEMEELSLKIKSKNKVHVIYGGSVDANNVGKYTKKENIDGVLVGGESLIPENFLELLKNA